MEIVDSGKDKVKKICETLKKQTLDPAKQEARNIIDHALKEAEKIIKQAKDEAKEILEEQKVKLHQEKKAFFSSLNLAGKQTIEALKQQIQHHLFDQNIAKAFHKSTQDESLVVEFIQAIVNGVKKEGINCDFEIYLPRALSKQKIIEKLAASSVDQIQAHDIHLADFGGGVKVKLKDHHIVIEMTDESLKTLFSQFVRDEFRALIFDGKTTEK